MTTTRQSPATTTGRPRGRPRTGVREAILAAAEELLAVDGVGRLSTKELAKHAGVAESSIFYHFGDRLGLLHAIIEAHEPLYTDVADQLVSRLGHDSLRENLVLLIDGLESFFLRITPILAAMQADAVLRADFIKRGKELNAGPHRALALVIPYLIKEQQAGRVRPDADLEAVALLIVGIAHQHALDRHLTGKRATTLPTFAQAVALIAPMIEP
jgi:AcrR family transcriptional regulator